MILSVAEVICQVLLPQAGRVEGREDREVRLLREVDLAAFALERRTHGREVGVLVVEFGLAQLHDRQLGPRFLGEQYGGEPLRHDRVGRKPLFGVLLAGDVGRYLLQVAGLLGQFPAQVARIAATGRYARTVGERLAALGGRRLESFGRRNARVETADRMELLDDCALIGGRSGNPSSCSSIDLRSFSALSKLSRISS